jgi:hypothetical protein
MELNKSEETSEAAKEFGKEMYEKAKRLRHDMAHDMAISAVVVEKPPDTVPVVPVSSKPEKHTKQAQEALMELVQPSASKRMMAVKRGRQRTDEDDAYSTIYS